MKVLYSFKKHLLSTYSVPSPVLSAGEVAVDRTKYVGVLMGLHLVQKTDKKTR